MSPQKTTPDPLAFMTKLSPNVYVFYPQPSPPSDIPAPKLIILASWLSARPAHIAKYLTSHRTLYPTTPLLLIRTSRRAILLPSLPFRELAAFAVPVIRAACPTTTPRGTAHPDLLIHALSGGGSSALAHLRTLLAPDMPSHAVVFDSAPPRFAYGASARALAAGLRPAWFWALVMRLVAAWLWVEHVVLRRGGLARQAGVHNERGGRARSEVRRTYVYSEGDGVVGWRDVEGHAEEARGRGFEVRMERFEGTEHVAHVRGDGGRYWGVVKGTWEGTGGV